MRKTLLIAAATLAAGIISSQAGVYSQNIVGYANVPSPGNTYTLIANPFNIGGSNGLNEVFPDNLPANSYVLIYTNSAFTEYYYDTAGDGAPNGSGWYDPNEDIFYGGSGGPGTGIPSVVPGQGFLLYTAGPTQTNTFAGAVAISVGTSNNMVLTPNHYNVVGCVVPYAGLITNGNNSTGGPNIDETQLPANSYFLFRYNGGYVEAYFDTAADGAPNGTGFYDPNEDAFYVDPVTGGSTPSITVGEGFYLYPAGAYTWITGL